MAESKSLADGQASTTSTAVYKVMGKKWGRITCLLMLNTNAADQTVNVKIKRAGGTARQVRRFVLKQNEHAEAFGEDDAQPTLSLGDELLLDTTTASALDFFISGEEED